MYTGGAPCIRQQHRLNAAGMNVLCCRAAAASIVQHQEQSWLKALTMLPVASAKHKRCSGPQGLVQLKCYDHTVRCACISQSHIHPGMAASICQG